jgi:ATP-dependent 26S proteasome regulatory subunit
MNHAKKKLTQKDNDIGHVSYYNKKNKLSSELKHVWTDTSILNVEIMSYIIQNKIDEIADDKLLGDTENKYKEFNYDYGKFSTVFTLAHLYFIYKNKLFQLNINTANPDYTEDGLSIILKGNDNKLFEEIKEIFDMAILENNPIKGKLLYLDSEYGSLIYQLKPVSGNTFDDVILKDEIKEDIYDNSIYHLKHLDGNNGLILYGCPGSGKSLVCQAIINEAIKEEFSVCFLTKANINFGDLDGLINKFLGKTIIIFEDLDTLSVNREDVVSSAGSQLSDILQFMSGLCEKENGVVFIGTTNYIEHLDKALSQRPVRFNRKFHIDIPDNEEIDALLNYYFGKNIKEEEMKLCHNKKFTGSHIKEIQRTSMLLSKKKTLPIKEVFKDAVVIVSENFPSSGSAMGFK